MEHDDATARSRERRVSAWITAGLALIAAAGLLLTGPAAGACGVIGGLLLVQAAYAASCPGREDSAPPPIEDDEIAPTDDALPAVALRIDAPQPDKRWVQRTATTELAKRGR
jgi:hypothetical protein